MHSNLKKGLFLVTFLGDDSISGNFGYGSRWGHHRSCKDAGRRDRSGIE